LTRKSDPFPADELTLVHRGRAYAASPTRRRSGEGRRPESAVFETTVSTDAKYRRLGTEACCLMEKR
jgi:hypothetical protein